MVSLFSAFRGLNQSRDARYELLPHNDAIQEEDDSRPVSRRINIAHVRSDNTPGSSAMSKLDSEVPRRRPLRSYIWDTWDKPPEERKFLAKLDGFLLTYAALSYFSK